MSSVSKTILIGRLGKDPECLTTQNGTKVARFSLATSEKYKNKAGEKVEDTEWHNCVAFGPLAGIIEQYVTKGMQLFIEGKNKTTSYEKDGIRMYNTSVVIKELKMMGGGKQSNTQQDYKNEQPQDEQPWEPEEDGLPF